MKPCDECTVKLEQTVLYDEVTCFKTCKYWLEWKGNEGAASDTDCSVGRGVKKYNAGNALGIESNLR